MHQNKIPRPAENRIIRIGDGAVFLIFLQIRCVAPSMANTAIERKSGANPACKSVRPNSVDSAMLSAVARIIATTHGRTPDKKALTGAYFIRFFSADAIKRIIKNDGNTTPSVATNEPRIPPCVEPIKVAIFTARGPGVDSDTAKIQKLVLCQPAVGKHRFAYQRNHSIAAAERQGTDHQKVQKETQVYHDVFPSPFRIFRRKKTTSPTAPQIRM